ncbi:copper chaperone PCu(A)C [Rhodococcus sp. OK302]|uniref:copper chaperone PCu(A)C n=1 Tax=Rhodococcus sp. OK302 TaxID=1882769 RepID=UPI000B93A50E|nr:copper chaperone PCu(A)C [Rhodococcus sp. OK302]OYD66508.1 hypothetical protein BDB13_0002 [Rhodococcus sp. OK302]
MSVRTKVFVVAALSAALTLTGCSSNSEKKTEAAQSITVQDQWIKAAPEMMSSGFAELTNTGDTDVRLVAATSPASARVELHEVVSGDGGTMTMRPKDGGLLIPAHGTASLAPGADHLMFMELAAPLLPGTETDVTLVFDDGSSTTFNAQIRDFSGNQENYDPNHGG